MLGEYCVMCNMYTLLLLQHEMPHFRIFRIRFIMMKEVWSLNRYETNVDFHHLTKFYITTSEMVSTYTANFSQQDCNVSITVFSVYLNKLHSMTEEREDLILILIFVTLMRNTMQGHSCYLHMKG